MSANDSQRQHRMTVSPLATDLHQRVLAEEAARGQRSQLDLAAVDLGCGRIVASAIEIPNMLVNLV